VTSVQALQWNVGTCRVDVKREMQVDGLYKHASSNAAHRGGVARSSDEASVMEVEQRGCPIQLNLMNQL